MTDIDREQMLRATRESQGIAPDASDSAQAEQIRARAAVDRHKTLSGMTKRNDRLTAENTRLRRRIAELESPMTTTPKPAPSDDAVSALKAVVAQCEANHGRLPMSPEVQAVYDLCVAAIAKAALSATIPVAEPVDWPETRVWPFGNGSFVVTDGTWKGWPAVFISPAKFPGSVNTPISASEQKKQPLDRLTDGEVVLTFPTAEQASYVLDALFNRPRGSGLTGATRIALREVKPLDLSILLEHAFLSGRGATARDGVSEADQKALSGYDPSDLPCFQRIRSALAAASQSALPVVETLKWTGEGGLRRAGSALGAYAINKYVNLQDPYKLILPVVLSGESRFFSTLDAAKAAAQVDYEQRIRSALVASPQPARETEAAELRDLLGLFRAFVLHNATQWVIGSNHHHPIWGLLAAHLEGFVEPTSGERWKLVMPAALRAGGQP